MEAVRGRGKRKQRQKLRNAASAANRLVTKPKSRKDRKTALAAAARLFELAASDPSIKIEFVGGFVGGDAESDGDGDSDDGLGDLLGLGGALNEAESDDESDGEEVEASDGGETGLEAAMADRGYVARDASPQAWADFWARSPKVVAIDAEGTHLEPPLLVQIASDASQEVLVVEPSHSVGADLARLLGDPAITKCFFGNPKHERLGCDVANAVDVQRKAGPGERGRSRGLAEVCGELVRGRPFAKNKALQRSFGFVRARPSFVLSPAQRAYAAADAWATLEIWRRLPRKRGRDRGGGGARKRWKSDDTDMRPE